MWHHFFFCWYLTVPDVIIHPPNVSGTTRTIGRWWLRMKCCCDAEPLEPHNVKMKIKQIYIYILRLLPRVSCLRMQTHAPSVNGGCFVLRVLQSTTFFLLATCNSDFNRTDGFFLREFSDYNDNAFNGAWHASHSSALWRAFVLVHALVFIGRPRMSYLLCKCAFKRHAMPCRCSGFGAGRTSEMPFKASDTARFTGTMHTEAEFRRFYHDNLIG